MRMQQNGILGGIPAPRGPKSPQQVAAEQIVESDVPKELEALIKERKALELLASAQRDKQAQQPVQPQTVKSQVEGGLASMMDRLRPGMAQRGRQVQMAQNRQAMGLPSMPAPNMARRMANGGVVGFQDRGFVDVDEIAEEYNLTPEGVDRLLDLSELSEERQEVEVQAPRERPMTPEERRDSLAANPDRIDNIIGNYIGNFVKENPVEAAATLAMLPFGGGLAMGAGRLGLGALGRFAPRAGSTLSRLFTRPNPNVVRGPGFTMRPPGQGLRTFSPTRTGATLGATTLGVKGLYDGMTGGGDEVSAEEVAVAPAPREPTPQEKLGSMVGRPTAMFKAGEPETTRRGLGRDVDIDGLIAFLTSAKGTDFSSTLAAGARGARAYEEAERKRQDELDALEESQKIQRENIAATLKAAGVRATATQTAALQKLIGEYLVEPMGYLSDLANYLGKDIKDVTAEDKAAYGSTVIQNYINNVSGQATQALGGVTSEDVAGAQAYLDAQA